MTKSKSCAPSTSLGPPGDKCFAEHQLYASIDDIQNLFSKFPIVCFMANNLCNTVIPISKLSIDCRIFLSCRLPYMSTMCDGIDGNVHSLTIAPFPMSSVDRCDVVCVFYRDESNFGRAKPWLQRSSEQHWASLY